MTLEIRKASHISGMASWFSALNPVKSFPDYNGLYDVGTVDVEIPASDLPAPSDAPEDAQATVAFRMFYPCVKPTSSEVDRPVHWIPQPQKPTLAALLKFLTLRETTAKVLSYGLHQLYWIKLPAHRNAKLLEPPTSNAKWPVAFFSHGLAGSRNAYSQICGDLASNGVVVIALDHRDGSSPVQYVRATATTEAKTVDPVKIPHSPITDEVYAGRDKQLRIRLWEISMAYEALTKIDAGHRIENLDMNTSRDRTERVEVLYQFNDMLDIQRPGKVTWAGHSFGAATSVQLLKSIYYHKERTEKDGKPLISPKADAAIIHQITADSPLLLLDMWGMPMKSPQQQFLWDRPLPSYTVGGPNGSNILSILSESFHNWKDNLNLNKHVIAAPSASRRPSAVPMMTREKGRLLPAFARLRAASPAGDSGYASQGSQSRPSSLARSGAHSSVESTSSVREERGRTATPSTGPHMFYAGMSQHFSQSDFGVLFPWIAKKVSKAEEPERILELNSRAMAQLMRISGVEIGGDDDSEILDEKARVRRWIPITVEDDGPAEAALRTVDRKLSITSTKSRPEGKESMTMGQKMEDEGDVVM